MVGLFGNMFDMNRDGKLNMFERAMELQFLDSVTRKNEENDYWCDEDWDDELTELEMAGIDPEELEYMDDEERREVLEEAGLDPDDYDF